MEDVQNIMNKMENLDKKTDTSNEAEKALLGVITTQESDPLCPNFTRDVSLCCTAVVPNNFTVNLTGSIIKFIYDPSCLHAIVEKATVSICGTNCGDICVFLVKVVGCIPFAFSAPNALIGQCGNRTTPATEICCHCCACVNNNICCYSDANRAEEARALIASKLNCTDTTNGILITTPAAANVVTCACNDGSPATFTNCGSETYVRFTATLTVPFQPCLAHISPNCGDI